MKQRNSKLYILIVIGMVSALGPFVTDFYLPALPGLTTFFNTAASQVQLSLTFSMIGLAIGQVFLGPISDKYGRKIPLLLSMFLFILSTIACILSPNIESLIFFRFIQGFAGAGGIVISKSIATDLYSGKDLSNFFSMLSCVQGLAPICAPVLGGVLLEITNWQGIFCTLLLIGIALTVVLFKFKESLPKDQQQKDGILTRFTHYKSVLRNRNFMYLVLVQSFAMGVMFAYISSSPFIFQEHYHLTPILYSLCFGLNALGVMLGNLSIILFKTNEQGLSTGTKGFMIMCCITSVALCLGLSILIIEILFFFFLFFLGMILPTSTALALNLERNNSGNASATLGFLTFLFGGIVSPLTGMGNILYSTSAIMLICCVFILICTRKALKSAENKYFT